MHRGCRQEGREACLGPACALLGKKRGAFHVSIQPANTPALWATFSEISCSLDSPLPEAEQHSGIYCYLLYLLWSCIAPPSPSFQNSRPPNCQMLGHRAFTSSLHLHGLPDQRPQEEMGVFTLLDPMHGPLSKYKPQRTYWR